MTKPRRMGASAAAASLSMLLLASACSGSSKGPGGKSPSTTAQESPSPTSGRAFPLGHVEVTDDARGSGGCLAGDRCKRFVVTCPEISQDARGLLDIGDPVGKARGLLVFLSGGGGDKLWSQEAKQDLQFSGQGGGSTAIDQQAAQQAATFIQGLRQQGFMTVQVVWRVAWLAAPEGDPIGPARLGCRPATLLKWFHDNYFEPMGVNPAPLGCGFCVTGNSSGASQIAYSLAFYGLGGELDAVVESGGPPHAALHKACLNLPGYAYTPGLDSALDVSYGFFRPERGPCELHDPSWAPRWKRDGADTGGFVYSYPKTRILLILGGQDATQVGPHQMDYLARLRKAGSPHLDQVTIPDMTHAITASQEGLSRISDWFLASS